MITCHYMRLRISFDMLSICALPDGYGDLMAFDR